LHQPGSGKSGTGEPRRWLAGWWPWAALAVALAVACARSGPAPVSTPAPAAPVPVTSPPPAAGVPVPVTSPPVVPVTSPPPPATPAEPLPPAPELPTGPLVLRVGLATDLRGILFPCCDPRIRVELGDGEILPLDAEIQIGPGGTVTERAVYRVQVAALKDERQAAGIADYLEERSGEPAESVFDADTDLYRVRAGRFPNREQAVAFRDRLAALGVDVGDAWIASEGGSIEDPALLVVRGEEARTGETRTVAGRWLDVTAPEGVGIRFAGGRYRGRLLIFLNDRGLLNVINEVGLEEYLRGVVPKEMGPEQYDRLEALKAQAVAARTFAVRNLDGFTREGYDICSTPRCQVYGGMGVEHPVSDRAVRETAGQVVLASGEPAETFYSATCGGHTENVEVVFPEKRGAYLRGVPCLESGVTAVRGDQRPGLPFPDALTLRLLPPAPAGKPQRLLAARVEHLALLAGLPVPEDRLRSLDRRELRRFVASVFDLALDRRLLGSGEALRPLLARPPAGWNRRELRLARFLVDSGLLGDGTPDPAAGSRPVADAEVEELLFHLALYLGVLEHRATDFLTVHDGRLIVREGAERRSDPLPESLATFRLRGGRLESGPLELMAGDRLDLYHHRGELVAVAQPVAAPPVSLARLARLAPHHRWSRYMTRSQLRNAVQARYPGFPFEGFEVLSRGASGRVGKLRLLGSDGRTLLVEGLAVRWTLDLRDTLFHAQPYQADGREPGWLFRGRGWGHGVGMCQIGAYGMALRGNDYRAILEHYYTGVELGRLVPAPRRPRTAEAEPLPRS